MAEQQKSFADYVKDLMSVLPTVNSNPMLSVTSQTDADKYRENPFYMQDAIRKRIAEEEAAKKAAQAKSVGMFGAMPSSGGDSAGGITTPSFFDVQEGETPSQRDARVADWAQANPNMAKVTGFMQDLFGKSPLGLLQNRLSPDYVRDVNVNNIMNRAQTAQANLDYASIARQAALDTAAKSALGTTGYGLYDQSARSGDWSWVDNMNDSTYAGMVAGMSEADAAGNAAAAAAMERDFGISGADI